MKTKDEIAALRAQIAKLEAKVTPPPYPTEAEVAAHRDAMHQMAERRASAFNPFTRDQMEEFRKAAPDDLCKQIGLGDARASPTVPRGVIPQDAKENVRGGRVGDGSGWATHTPVIRNGLGQGR
jgi:hypothetical protein